MQAGSAGVGLRCSEVGVDRSRGRASLLAHLGDGYGWGVEAVVAVFRVESIGHGTYRRERLVDITPVGGGCGCHRVGGAGATRQWGEAPRSSRLLS